MVLRSRYGVPCLLETTWVETMSPRVVGESKGDVKKYSKKLFPFQGVVPEKQAILYVGCKEESDSTPGDPKGTLSSRDGVGVGDNRCVTTTSVSRSPFSPSYQSRFVFLVGLVCRGPKSFFTGP